MTSSLTRIQNHDDDDDDASSSSSKKRSNTFDNGDVAPWSDVNHEVLLLVMMHLGFADFLAFSGVCKSWRSLALSNKKWFMASKPPMWIWRNVELFLEDFEERRFKTMIPHSAGRNFHGITCGYLIFYVWETRDFLLVNPITGHELEFPDFQMLVGEVSIRAILVTSPSISGQVFVVLHSTRSLKQIWSKPKISFYIEGKQRWNHVSSTVPIIDLHFFKGKIYTLHRDCSVSELRLYPNRKRKSTLLETKNFLNPVFKNPELVSSVENLYVISRYLNTEKGMEVEKVMELDIGEKKWVLPEKTIQEYAFFISHDEKSSAAMKLESWVGPQTHTQFKSYFDFVDDDKSLKCMFYYNEMWYFPHDCLSDNVLDES